MPTAEGRKYADQTKRREAFVNATPRVLFKPWRFDHPDRDFGHPPTRRPDVIRAGEIRFVPSHAVTSSPYSLGAGGLKKLKERTSIEPDMISVPRERMVADRAAGRPGGSWKPTAVDLRKLDAIDARIVKLKLDRVEHLKAMAERARPLTVAEIVAIGQKVKAFGDGGYVRPESAAKKVRLPR